MSVSAGWSMLLRLGIPLASCVFSLALCVVAYSRRYGRDLLVPAFALSCIAPLFAVVAVFTADGRTYPLLSLLASLHAATSFILALILVEFSARFMRDPSERQARIPYTPLRRIWIARLTALCATAAALVYDQVVEVQAYNAPPALVTRAGLISLALLVALLILVVYSLEHTLRNAQVYQRRISRLVTLPLLAAVAIHLVFLVRTIGYRTLGTVYMHAAAAGYCVCVPMALLGLVRYRLGTERIQVSRDTVYSSITLVLAGAILLGVAGAVMVGRRFGVRFNDFQFLAVLFAVAFLAVLAVTSGNLRVRISHFLDTHVYRSKYDYRDQFFQLHDIYMTGSNLGQAVTDLVENMKYTLGVEDAFVFLHDLRDGNFHMHENPEFSTREGIVLYANSGLLSLFDDDDAPLDFAQHPGRERETRARAAEGRLLDELHIAVLFPIAHGRRLCGLLGIRHRPNRPLDEEDVALVRVFTRSIGNVLLRFQGLEKQIEQKQFESFSHVASFIIHDIKNQVATLSLLARNADKNIANPAFQQSLVGSLRICTGNLQHLVDRLASPRREVDIRPHPVDARQVVETLLDQMRPAQPSGISLETSFETTNRVEADVESLSYVLQNIVTNAVEALGGGGRVAVSVAPIEEIPGEFRRRLARDERRFRGSAAILVSDTGPGMSSDFVENRLFRPFSTTKDKGIGIGLYQSKLLVERMGGMLLCESEQGKGATFCIVLPPAAV